MLFLKKIRVRIEHLSKHLFRYIGNALYWLRTHTINRYHIIDIRNKRNGYAWGWLDRSEGILFANMAILVDFVEKEKAFDCHVSWESAQEANLDQNDPGASIHNAHAFAKKEMLDVYNWWIKGRKEEHDALEWMDDEAFKNCKFEFEPIKDGFYTLKHQEETDLERQLRAWSIEYEDFLSEKDKEMMIRLVKISEYMWT